MWQITYKTGDNTGQYKREMSIIWDSLAIVMALHILLLLFPLMARYYEFFTHYQTDIVFCYNICIPSDAWARRTPPRASAWTQPKLLQLVVKRDWLCLCCLNKDEFSDDEYDLKDVWVNADKKALESDENTNDLSYSILKQDDPQESW